MYKCTIIGISDRRDQWFAPDVLEIISRGTVFSGGKRHHEIVSQWLPSDSQWIDITVPLDAVFEQYAQHDDVVIFASGDPLFYGFAATVQRMLPECDITVLPTFNSLQTLAHRMCLPYHDMHVVSLTGRPWDKLDEALITGESLIGCLTDKVHTPHAIHERMLAYGYDNYRMTVGENLGNENDERISEYDSAAEYAMPNCVILQRTYTRPRPFGIPETDFALLNGRAKMITKMPVRMLSLSMLELRDKRTFWDVGFCTGSVSIEAKLQFPHLNITAFEVREEGRDLMAENARRFGTPGIETVIGDFMSADLSQYERPDAVFIGGHGGRLAEMITRIQPLLNPGGCIVFNSVSEESRQMFMDGISACGMSLASSSQITIDQHNPIHILKAELPAIDHTSSINQTLSTIPPQPTSIDHKPLTTNQKPHIEIVGAGPGDPDLISVRGRRFLEQADLILYAGSLVPVELTHCHKPGATVRSSADMALEDQFQLMKEFYDQGKLVVRLHTGDPCIYGAIQEQMAFFDEYGMDYHITPGISSFLAAAAELRSQFTIPEECQTIILTRGEGRTPMPPKEKLHMLAEHQSTMCIFLSASIADEVQRQLLEGGYPPDTPVAACYKLTWQEQRIFRGELRDLARIMHDNHLTLTTMIVVGRAIDNRHGLSKLYDKKFTHLFRQGKND